MKSICWVVGEQALRQKVCVFDSSSVVCFANFRSALIFLSWILAFLSDDRIVTLKVRCFWFLNLSLIVGPQHRHAWGLNESLSSSAVLARITELKFSCVRSCKWSRIMVADSGSQMSQRHRPFPSISALIWATVGSSGSIVIPNLNSRDISLAKMSGNNGIPGPSDCESSAANN